MAIRNDPWLNSCKRMLLMSWLANIDIPPCTSTRGVTDYVTMYATKAEKKSQTYCEMAVTLLGKLNPTMAYQSFTSKMINRLLGERDTPAQEVSLRAGP